MLHAPLLACVTTLHPNAKLRFAAAVVLVFEFARRFGVAFGWATAVFVRNVFLDKPKLHRCTLETEALAQCSLHVAAVTPVHELSVTAKDLESRSRVVVLLDDVVQLGGAVLQPGRRVGVGDFFKPVVQLASGQSFTA